jgi:CheY-like chemotaxis protein
VGQIKLKILIVDQKDSHYLRSLVDFLTEGDFNVDFCSDPETTYLKLKNSVRPVDLLIIDLGSIQETDGFLFLKALKEQDFCRNLRVVVTTNSLLDNRLSPAQTELGICAFFNKARPFEELFYIVADILPPGVQELRGFRRIPVRILVDYVVDGNTQLHYASNLSQGGIFIRNVQPDSVGTMASLSFNLPGSSFIIEAKAKAVRAVRYSTDVSSLRYETFPPGNGFLFVEMTPEYRFHLKEFVDREESRIFGSRQELAECGEKR